MTRAPWLPALAATLLIQTTGTFLSQIVPVVAPRMTAELGLPPEAVGNFSSITILGSILFLMFGAPLVAAVGPARLLQAGTLAGAAALALIATGAVWLLPVAALLMGLGYGPTGPAASRILQATAPPRHRVLIFSIKQAGAPAGGALAGLVAAPVAAAFGWQAAILAGIAMALASVLALRTLRGAHWIETAARFAWRDIFTLARFGAPVAALRLHPVLPPLCLQAFAFAALQGSLFSFTVTWLVVAHGFGLTAAGTVFAAMQIAGVLGRLALGWAADRTGDATRSLCIHGLDAAALTMLWLFAGPTAPWGLMLALAFLCGFAAASWNGIFLAEVARVVPADRVAEASSGAILLCFLGYLMAPAAFAVAVTVTGSWMLPFCTACGLLAAISAMVLRWRAAR